MINYLKKLKKQERDTAEKMFYGNLHWRVLASNRVMTFNAGFRRILLTSRLALHNKRERGREGGEGGGEGGREEEKVNRNGMAAISYTPSRCMLSSG